MTISYFRAANPIWTVFDVDGKLAAGGRIDTWRSADKDERKATYQDPAGTIEAPNPLILDSIGQLPPDIYWADDEKYYLELYDFRGRLIRAVDNFPDSGSGGGTSVVGLDFENNLLNGQFRFHFDELIDPVSSDEIDIAYYWVFHKSNTTATDKITFTRLNLGDDTDGTPIYDVNYICTGQGSGELYKDFKQQMGDVRTFEQTKQTFSMQVYSDVPRTIEIFFVQDFGTGGSPSPRETTPMGTFSLIGGIREKQSCTITVPSTSGKTRGTNDDDYIAILIRMPLDSVCNIKFTDCYLASTDKVLPYPRITKEKEDSELLGAMIPEVGKSDYGKAITANRHRTYDLSFPVPVGGFLEYAGQTYTDDDDWAICQGQTVNVSQNTNRYSRLFDAIGHYWGRGTDAWVATSNGAFVTLGTTTETSVSAPTNGGVSPGFTITQYVASSSSRHLFNAEIDREVLNGIVINNIANGLATSISNAGNGALSAASYNPGNVSRPHLSALLAKAGSAITAGQYFSVYTGVLVGYTFWYQVNGVGSAPAVTGTTNIMIPINSSDTANQVALRTLAYMAGIQVDFIQVVAAVSIAAGSYININTHALQYYAWFKVGNTGSDPKITGRTGIEVDLASGDSDIQVATKLADRINAEFFRIPDRRGTFPRGFDPSGIIDFDPRVGGGGGVGSLQIDQVIRHTHGYSYERYSELDPADGGGAAKWTLTIGVNATTTENIGIDQGGYETRPVNVAVNYLIKL